MKKYFIAIFLMLGAAGWLGRPVFSVNAAPPPAVPPTLAISELKITGDEFVVLRNNSGKDISDLSGYWLDAFNSSQPVAPGVSRSTQQLPAVRLGAGQTLLLSSNGMATCGAAAVSKLSVGLTDSGGFLQVVQVAQNSLGVTQLPVDYVSWSSGSDPLIPNVPSNSKDPKAVYYRYANSTGYAWQLADLNAIDACQLDVAGAASVSTGLAPPTSPVPSVVSVSSVSLTIPADDRGLAVPQISEILPNPAPPQTDANDEFIELYNSNDKAFDLSGFILEVGSTTLHKYTFSEGTAIEPRQFTAFYSSDTGLSLSNSSGQVRLLDPGGNIINQSAEYGTAKDGYAWISVGGQWQWTTSPTPNAANIISAPPSAKSKTGSSSSQVKAVSTSPASNTNTGTANPPSAVKMHPLVLAGVGLAAVLYASYEYRHDLANLIYKFRRHREARQSAGQTAEGR